MKKTSTANICLSILLVFLFTGFTSQLEAQISVSNETQCWIYFGAREGVNCVDCASQEMWIAPGQVIANIPHDFSCNPQNWQHIKYGVSGIFPNFFFQNQGISWNVYSITGPCSSDVNGSCFGTPINHEWGVDPSTGEAKFQWSY